MDKKRTSIYTAAILQGIALVSFPAASTILTNPHTYHLTNTEYGSLFIPQAVLSIITALLNSLFCKYFSANKTLAMGLGCNFLSMLLLTLSALIMKNNLAYIILLLATSCLGIGFGVVVPTINRMIAQLSPKTTDRAILTLNALLGIGTALAPAFIALFSLIGVWWGLSLCLSLATLLLLLCNLSIDFPEKKSTDEISHIKSVRSWNPIIIFILFAFLYGIIETINGTWLTIYMRTQLHASMSMQSLALTTFWGMVTFGRFFSAMMAKFLSQQIAFRIAPFVSTIAFLILSSDMLDQAYESVIVFGLMGLGCSIIFPLLISFGGDKLKEIATWVPGMIVSFYLLGYGVAAFGVGPLQELSHLNLRDIYAIGACISFALGLFSFYLTCTKKNQGAH